MGSWSTTAPSLPSGSSWSGEQNTGGINDNYYKARCVVAIARGPSRTIYIRYKIQSYLKIQGEGARSFPIKARVKVGSGSEETSGNYAGGGEHYGYWKTMATVYYTGIAESGTTVACRTVQGSSVSTATSFSAPALITFAIFYNGNGSDGGGTSSQTKVYDETLTLMANGFTRSGHAFTNWNTKADGTGASYAGGGSYTDNAEATMYAQWIQTNIPVFINVGGEVHQVAKAFINDNGEIKECKVYMNVNNEIKLLQ